MSKELHHAEERKKFEKWFQEESRPDQKWDFTLMPFKSGMCYANGYVRATWKGWLARSQNG